MQRCENFLRNCYGLVVLTKDQSQSYGVKLVVTFGA